MIKIHFRSYRRYSTRSRSSSSEYSYARRYSQDRKKKSHSKNSDVFRRSSKRDERHFGCSCNCINYCKKSTKQSQTAKNKSKSPSFDLKQNNISPSDSKRNKRSTTALNDANGMTFRSINFSFSIFFFHLLLIFFFIDSPFSNARGKMCFNFSQKI